MSVTILGLLTVIAGQFVPAEEIQVVMEAVGIIVAWYGRIRIADINWLGLRRG